jgi:hypothetical protein
MLNEVLVCHLRSQDMSAISNARNVNLQVPVYFLKGKQGYTVRKMEEDKWI